MNTRRAFINKAAGTVAAVAFTRCGLLGAASAQAQTRPSGRRREVTVRGRRVKTIDVHAHCVIPEAVALMGRKLDQFRGPGMAIVAEDRIGEMNEQGIDVEALSINPFHILHTPSLSDAERAAILGDNAARLLGIKA